MIQIDNHTNFSAGKSVVNINKLVEKAKLFDSKSLGITDDSNIHGAIEFYKLCKSENIKPIIGADIFLTDTYSEKSRRYPSVLFICKNIDGYKNICKLISEAYINGFYYVPRTTLANIEKYSEGLICLLGSVNNPIRFYKELEQEQYSKFIEKQLSAIFLDDFYQEINPFEDEDTVEYNKYIKEYFPFSYFINNHVRFLEEKEYDSYDMMFCIDKGLAYSKKNRKTANSNFYYASESDIKKRKFGLNEEEIEKALKETELIADKVDLKFEKKIFFPDYKKIPWIDKSKTPDQILKSLINNKWKEKAKTLKEEEIEIYKNRILFEVESVCRLGYSTYFIVVSDIVQKAKDLGILVGPGRGSVAGCMISHLLGITSRIDPIKHGLIFERFLDPTGQRVSPPDIDIDFEDDKKDILIKYIIETYGEEYVSSVGNINTLAFKAAMKEVSKPLEIPFERANEYTKIVPYKIDNKTDLLKYRHAKNEYRSNPEFASMLDHGESIKGSMKALGTHAAGLVITPEPITDYSPIQLTKDGSACKYTTQLDKDSLEYIGVQKIDLLALTTLSTISNCLRLIKERHNKEIDLESIDLEDLNIYKNIINGHTIGLFQLEGEGMTELGINMNVNCLSDICDLIALYRPVVLEEELEKVYVKNKNSGNITYIHEKLEQITKETYGILVYQEQIMKASILLANFTIPESDTLRKAIGKKSTKDIPELKEKFIKGCALNGIDESKAREIFGIFEEASYGFNKSHSLSYAVLSCYTMWLKCYYNIEYMTALLMSEARVNKKEKFLRIEKIINECKHFGINVLKPEANKSKYTFNIESDNEIRYGLLPIKEIGEAFSLELSDAFKDKNAENFDQFLDILGEKEHISIYKSKLECLIRVGFFDCFSDNRARLLKNLEDRLTMLKTVDKIDKSSGLLFNYFDLVEDKEEEIEDFNRLRKKSIEKENLGHEFS